MKVRQFMSQNPFTITQDKTVADAAKLMIDNNVSCLPVVDNGGALVGLITESDFVGKKINVPHALTSMRQFFGQKFYFSDIEKLYDSAKDRPLSEVMSSGPKTVGPDMSINELALTMVNTNHKRFPVIEDGKLVGVITRKDMIKAFAGD